MTCAAKVREAAGAIASVEFLFQLVCEQTGMTARMWFGDGVQNMKAEWRQLSEGANVTLAEEGGDSIQGLSDVVKFSMCMHNESGESLQITVQRDLLTEVLSGLADRIGRQATGNASADTTLSASWAAEPFVCQKVQLSGPDTPEGRRAHAEDEIIEIAFEAPGVTVAFVFENEDPDDVDKWGGLSAQDGKEAQVVFTTKNSKMGIHKDADASTVWLTTAIQWYTGCDMILFMPFASVKDALCSIARELAASERATRELA